MSENERESGEENIDESGRNPTQQRMDETGEGSSDKPADPGWPDTVEGQDTA